MFYLPTFDSQIRPTCGEITCTVYLHGNDWENLARIYVGYISLFQTSVGHYLIAYKCSFPYLEEKLKQG